MTPEKLLEAMTDLEDNTIMDARKTTPHRGGTRKFVVLIAAVVAMMAIGLTAFAAEEISGWFARYFANNAEMPLSTEQLDFIEENEQIIGQVQVQDNCTLELKSALTDGEVAYFILRVTAPEGMVIEEATIGNWGGPGMLMPADEGIETMEGSSLVMWKEEDDDGLGHTMDLVIQAHWVFDDMARKPFGPGETWKLHIEDFVVNCKNQAYIDSLEMEDGAAVLTEEEMARAYTVMTLAEGTWDYEITFDNPVQEIEVLTEPVTAWAGVGPESVENVTIASALLRPMGITLVTDKEYGTDFTKCGDCYVVMKDGSTIPLGDGVSSLKGTILCSKTPIILEAVDYIVLGGSTTIPVSAEQVAEVELIDTPITLSICVGMRPEDGRDVYMDMKITSFVLRSLSASIYCEDTSFAPEIGNNFDRTIYVVMEDGQRIRLKADTGLPGEQKLVAEAPILLESVDYVLLPGGTKLPMP